MTFYTKGTNFEIEFKNPWGDRLLFLKDHLPSGATVVDFGCGNKEVLNYFSPASYFGIDKFDHHADLNADLDRELILENKYEVGLVIGVLEYLDDPDFTLNNIKKYADKFLILMSTSPKKAQWKNSFTKESIEQLVSFHFKSFKTYEYHRYILCVTE